MIEPENLQDTPTLRESLGQEGATSTTAAVQRGPVDQFGHSREYAGAGDAARLGQRKLPR